MGLSERKTVPEMPETQDTGVQDFLFEKSQKIYPRQVHGLFAGLRTTGVIVLLGIFYGLPWLRYDGQQAVLLDLPARQFHLFGLTLWPQDFIFLALLMAVAGLTLFFFTALAGRIWCGYACPQTVWTEVFLWMERMVEGNRAKQIKLDKAPWSLRKARIKSTKHAIWIAFAAFTGFTFVGYFTPITELWHKLLAFSTGPWETFWIAFYGFATYGNAGWMREQVCKYMCPYARFQGAMFDRDTLIVSYDPYRGEPRGHRQRGIDHKAAGLGDCINCQLCVQVCPTGIDIRDGLQYECISCSACIDACDSVMDTMGYPRGLIRYTTQNAIDGKPTRVLRPRVFVYGTILLVLLGSIVTGIAMRSPYNFDVLRDRQSLYRELGGGMIENTYTIRILNKDRMTHTYRFDAEGLSGLELAMDHERVTVEAGSVLEVPVRLRAEETALTRRSHRVDFHLTTEEHPDTRVSREARFLGPIQ